LFPNTKIVKSWLEVIGVLTPDSLREYGSTVTVLLEQDLEQIRKASFQRKDKVI
jgi:hypothetical protein